MTFVALLRCNSNFEVPDFIKKTIQLLTPTQSSNYMLKVLMLMKRINAHEQTRQFIPWSFWMEGYAGQIVMNKQFMY